MEEKHQKIHKYGNNDSNYDGKFASRHFRSGTYEILDRLILVEQSVHSG